MNPRSQSLSGWDGVFHRSIVGKMRTLEAWSQSLSGWDGVFHGFLFVGPIGSVTVAIPFRVGWGFSLLGIALAWLREHKVAIPFRVGWGFSRGLRLRPWHTHSLVAIPFRVGWGFSQVVPDSGYDVLVLSQSLSGWDGVFHQKASSP